MSRGDLEDMPLSELFREELTLQATRMAAILAELGGSANPASLADLVLAAHSARGAARIVGFDAVEGLAHAVELLAGAARDGRVEFGPAALLVAEAQELMLAVAALPEPEWPAWTRAHGGEAASLAARLAVLRG